MANFVVAGMANCPYYAKAELLGDLLHTVLPDFQIYKIPVHPNDWKRWLENTCSANGWKHDESVIVWRELIDRGGKGLFLGGLSDFVTHAQDYYGVTFEMEMDLLLKIADENLEVLERQMQEEEQQRQNFQSFHIWISSASSLVGYNLIPLLFTSGIFSNFTAISLHLLDVDSNYDSLLGLKLELEDMALPEAHEVTVHSDLSLAFNSADLIVFLDEGPLDEQPQVPGGVVEQFEGYGQRIEVNAKKEVRVLVAGNAFVNLKCSLLIENAPSVAPWHFVAVAAQLENEARFQVAKKLGVRGSDVAGLVIWGNISGSFYADLQRAMVYNYKGAFQGPTGFTQKILEMIHEGKWLRDNFPTLVGSRRRAISNTANRAAAISAANGIIRALCGWFSDSSKEVFSMGVASTGIYDIPVGMVFSLPVTFHHGEWSVCSDFIIYEDLKRKLEVAVNELTAEKAMAMEGHGIKMEDPDS